MKGLLITFVVIGHLHFFEYNSRTLTLIYSFHMPAFLIIGGILSHVNEDTKFSHILYKRFKGILVPYFIFYLISLIIIPVNSYENKMKAIVYMLNGIGNPNYAVNLPLWFLTFYFSSITIFELIECFFYKIKMLLFGQRQDENNKKFFFVEFCTFLVIANLMYISFYYARILKLDRLVFNFEIALFCLGFVFFGKLVSLFVPCAYNFCKKNTATAVTSFFFSFLVICVLTIYWYTFSMKNGRIDLNARDYKNAFYMYFDAIIGFIIFAFFSYIISFIPLIKNIFSIIGKNSIYVLAYHVPSYIVTANIILPLLPAEINTMLSYNSIFSIICLTSFGILISLFCSLIHKACHFPA